LFPTTIAFGRNPPNSKLKTILAIAFCRAMPAEKHIKERKRWKFRYRFGKIEYWTILKILKNGKNRQFRFTPAHSGEHPAALCARKSKAQPVRGI
jgi:hypothetical protein